MIHLFKMLLALPDRAGRVKVFSLLPLMAMASMLELIGLGLLISLVNVLLGASESAMGPTKWASDFLRAFDTTNVAIFVVVFVIIKNFALMGLNYLTARISFGTMAEFLIRLYRHYLHQPYKHYLQRNTGEFLNHLSSSAPIGFDSLRLMLETILELLLTIVTLSVLITAQPKLTLTAGVLLMVVAFTYHKIVGPAFRRWGAEAYIHEVNALTLAKETFNAIKEILVYGYQDHFVRRYGIPVVRRARLQSLTSINLSGTRTVLESVLVVGIGGFVILAAQSDTSAADNAAVVSVFGIAAIRLLPSANRILANLSELTRRTKIIELLHAEMVAADQWQDKLNTRPAAVTRTAPSETAISLTNVSYTYPSVDAPSVEDINLVVKRGETVGLAGASGAGKSTTIEIILGLISPQLGEVVVDGTQVTDINPPQKIGFVPQLVSVIDDTVRRNVAFGVEDDLIDDDAVWAAIESSRLGDAIRQMDAGLDTRLNEKGVRLSGGQRQRIGIARALYLNPGILILDEATSAVDNETEAQITESINAFRRSKTIIIIAHRLSTLRDCDYVLYFEAGKIAGKGSFEELIKTQPSFKRLVELGTL